jgi:hypothetical protein
MQKAGKTKGLSFERAYQPFPDYVCFHNKLTSLSDSEANDGTRLAVQGEPAKFSIQLIGMDVYSEPDDRPPARVLSR